MVLGMLCALAGCTSGWPGHRGDTKPEPTLSELLRASERASGGGATAAKGSPASTSRSGEDDPARQQHANSNTGRSAVDAPPAATTPSHVATPPKTPGGNATSASASRSLLEVLQHEYGPDLQRLDAEQRTRLLAVAAELERLGNGQPPDTDRPADTTRHKTPAPKPDAAPRHPTAAAHHTAAAPKNKPGRRTADNGSVVHASLHDTSSAGTVQPATAVEPASQPAPAATAVGNKPESPSRAAERIAADGQWQRLVEQAIEQLRGELNEDEAESAATRDERARQEILLRLLMLAAGDGDGALEAFQYVSGPEADYWRNQLFALHLATDPNRTPVVSRRAARLLEHLRHATRDLAAISTLDVKNAALCRNVYGFAEIEEFRPYAFRSDQEVLLYIELDNFAVERLEPPSPGKRRAATGGVQYETDFRASYRILDADRRRIADQKLPRDTQTCRNARRDYFIAYRIYMPKEIEPGKYTLEVTIEDVKGKKFGQAFLEFEIVK